MVGVVENDKGMIGINTDTGNIEYWDGNNWKVVSAT